MTRDNEQARWIHGQVVAAHWSPILVLGALATLATESLVSRGEVPQRPATVVVERCVPAARARAAAPFLAAEPVPAEGLAPAGAPFRAATPVAATVPSPAVRPGRAVERAPAVGAAPSAEPSAEPPVATSREYLRRGARYAAREQWEKALVAYTWARDTDPRSAAAHLGRALVLLELGRVDAAARAAARAQALARTPGDALVVQGLVAQLKGHRDVAYERYRASLAASPNGPWAEELRHIVDPAGADEPGAPRP